MKKFQFSLEKVLQLKEQILKNLKNDLATFQIQLAKKEEDIRILLLKYRETEDSFNKKSAQSIMPFEIKYYKDFLETILKNIKKEEDLKSIILKKIETKKQEIIDTNIEISTLEKLKEKKLAKYTYEEQKAHQILIEEFVSNVSVANQ